MEGGWRGMEGGGKGGRERGKGGIGGRERGRGLRKREGEKRIGAYRARCSLTMRRIAEPQSLGRVIGQTGGSGGEVGGQHVGISFTEDRFVGMWFEDSDVGKGADAAKRLKIGA